MSLGEELLSDYAYEIDHYERRFKNMANEGTNFTTDEVRLSFVHLSKPYAIQPGAPERYSVTCLLPKADVATKQRMEAAIQAAIQRGVQDKWNGVQPPNVKTPVWDGDGVKNDGTPFGPECKGCWVFTASTNADRQPPEVVDASMNPIINPSELYSGMYGRVNINAFPYNNSGNRGIGFGLGPVQKTRDGKVLGGGRVSAAAAFGSPVQTDADGFMPAPKVDPFSGKPM